MGFWIDPKKWKFKKGDADAEFMLQLQGQDLYAMIITEKIEIPLESLQQIAFDNALKGAPDLVVVKKEYRTVNGLQILFIQMNGTMKGVKATYYGYYYSGLFGSIQFVTYIAQNLIKNYIKDCEELLSGF